MNPQLIEIVHGRTNPMIDPTLHVWGWEVPVYLFLGGLVAGLMVLVPLLELRTGRVSRARRVRWLPMLGLGLISLGMGALFLDLEHKAHVFRFYTTFEPTSPMSWGSWILLGVYPVLALLGLGGLDASDRARVGLGPEAVGWKASLRGLVGWARDRRPLIRGLSIALGLGLGTYTGLLLGTLSARLLWSSALLGPLFMVSGLSAGAALVTLARPDEDERPLVERWDVLAIGIELALLAAMLLSFASGGAAQRAAAAPILGGSFTPHFWALVVGAGLVVPLMLELVGLRSHRKPTFAAPALVLVGGFALRALWVAAGQVTTFSGLG